MKRLLGGVPITLLLAAMLAACGGTAAPASPAAPSSGAASPAAPASSPASAAAKPATSAGASTAAKPAASAAASAAAKPAASPASSGLIKVRYGIGTNPPTITTVGAYFALDNGFFKDEGLDVQVTGFVGGPTTLRALLSRDIEVGDTTADAVFQSHQNGAPIKVIAGDVTKILDQILVVKSVGSIKDLAGKRWAISAPNSQSHGFAKIVLQKDGVDPAKVDFVAIGSPPDRVKSLLAGRADATTMVTFDQKEVLNAIDKGDIKVLGSIGQQVPDLANQYVISRDDLVTGQPDMLTRFTRALVKGERWMTENPEQAATVAEKHIPQSAHDDMVRGLKSMIDAKAWGVDGGFTLDSVDKAQALYQQLGIIPKTEKAADVATTQFIDQANKDLGPAK
jgi:NitT/TauT family transport system substrate-binding protein